MGRGQLVCVLAETRMSDGSRVVTQDLFPRYELNNGVPCRRS
jgi:hypothetical protein